MYTYIHIKHNVHIMFVLYERNNNTWLVNKYVHILLKCHHNTAHTIHIAYTKTLREYLDYIYRYTLSTLVQMFTHYRNIYIYIYINTNIHKYIHS